MHVIWPAEKGEIPISYVIIPYISAENVAKDVRRHIMHMHVSHPSRTRPDLAACHCTALRKAARQATLLYDRYLAPIGLTSGQFAILTQLATWPAAASPGLADLARALVLDRTALTRALQPLMRDGLVELATNPQDQRVRLVHLTARGRKRLAAASRLWASAQQQYERALGEGQAIALRALSQAVADVEFGEPATGRRIQNGGSSAVKAI